MNLDTLIDKLKAADKGDHDLDMLAWAYLGRHDWPLPDYDVETFLGCRSEGDPEAYLTSNVGAVTGWLERKWPGSRIEMVLDNGKARVDVSLRGLGSPIRSSFSGACAAGDMARGVACAVITASEEAETRRQMIYAENLHTMSGKLRPWKDWDVVQIGDRHHAVDHRHALMGAGAGDADKVHLHPHRIDDPSVLLKMRSRYRETFRPSEPGGPGGDDEPGV